MSRLLNSIPLLYAIMLYPAWPLVRDLFDENAYYAELMFNSGIWSVYFLIITIAVSPVLLLINRAGIGALIGRWLLKRRRHSGIVTAIYGGLHLLHYLLYVDDLPAILAETLVFELSIGWLALIIMVALAATSNNASTRKLGRRWKTLHYLVYPAAALTFLHWYLFDFFTARVMFWLGIFCAVKIAHGLVKLVPRRSSS